MNFHIFVYVVAKKCTCIISYTSKESQARERSKKLINAYMRPESTQIASARRIYSFIALKEKRLQWSMFSI